MSHKECDINVTKSLIKKILLSYIFIYQRPFGSFFVKGALLSFSFVVMAIAESVPSAVTVESLLSSVAMKTSDVFELSNTKRRNSCGGGLRLDSESSKSDDSNLAPETDDDQLSMLFWRE